jgi:hypothetical protein
MCSLWIVNYKHKFIIAIIIIFLLLAVFRFINNKNLGKRITNQNHAWTIHRNTTNSSIPLGSNIQFSTNTEKEQVIIRKTCFGLLITNINLLLLLLLFFYYWPFLDLFWISSPLNDIKYQLCYLKRCLYTQ